MAETLPTTEPYVPDSQKIYAHGGLKIFSLRGIPLRFDMTWISVLSFVLLWSLFKASNAKEHQAAINSIATWGVIYVSLIIHEYGHAFAAMKLGVRTKNILVTWFGGMAQLEREIIGREEFWITLWGPLMNLIILVTTGLVQYAMTGHIFVAHSFCSFIMSINLALMLFNLLPAWPMDGGRLFRSLVWVITKDNYKATLVAGRVAQIMGVLFILGVRWYPMLLLIGILVLLASASEIRRQAKLVPKVEVKEAEDDKETAEELTQVEAPWTDEQVKSINAFQTHQRNYPMMGEKNCILIATPNGFVQEANGPVVQDWAFEYMSDWSWKGYADTMESLYGSDNI